MAVLDTAVDPRAQSYLDARAAMLASLAELESALDTAREGGGERAVTRHHARGKLLARERIELLVDRDSPLLELSSVAGFGTSSPVGAAVVTALGVVEGRTCVLVASDPTVHSGAVNGYTLRKILRAQQIAHENRLPMINLVDAPGYEPAEHTEIFLSAGQVVAGFARLAAARIPTAGAFFGDSTVLGGADLADSFDYLVTLHAYASVRPADHRAEDERDALRLTRQCVLRFGDQPAVPSAAALPPVHDPEDLLAVPADDPREILARILDGSEFEEVQHGYGSALCTGWGTVHGHPVAVLADADAPAGPRLTEAAEKAARFVARAEAAGTPLLFLRHGIIAPATDPEVAMARAVAGASVPLVTVRVGGWRGLPATGTPARFRFAWPGAAAALAAPPRRGHPELPSESALALSGRLDDDGVIDPRDTRTVLGFCLAILQTRPAAAPATASAAAMRQAA